jgi:hypothetical protein
MIAARKLIRPARADMAFLDWNLAEALNVYQIALLSAGYDPAEYEDLNHSHWPKQTKMDTAAYISTIRNAALAGKIEFNQEDGQDDYGNRYTDWYASLIDVQSYARWLKERGHEDKFFNCSFFRRDESDLDNLLSPSSDFYAPKLAAAVRALEAVTADPAALAGKSPKRALETWLRKHASEFGLTNKDGKPNEQGIEEVCKVANWKPQGGASRTPTPVPAKPAHPLPPKGSQDAREPSTSFSRDEMDEEIPF